MPKSWTIEITVHGRKIDDPETLEVKTVPEVSDEELAVLLEDMLDMLENTMEVPNPNRKRLTEQDIQEIQKLRDMYEREDENKGGSR